MPHLNVTESQASKNCQCLFIKKRPCQTNLFYFFFLLFFWPSN